MARNKDEAARRRKILAEDEGVIQYLFYGKFVNRVVPLPSGTATISGLDGNKVYKLFEVSSWPGSEKPVKGDATNG